MEQSKSVCCDKIYQ